MTIPTHLRALIDKGPLAHLVTLNADGSPQVTGIWIGLDGDDIVSGHTADHRKLKNIRRDPRVAISLQYPDKHAELGIEQYAVLYGDAVVEEGGAPALIQRLARIYVGPNTNLSMDNMPPGFVMRLKVARIAGLHPTSTMEDKYGIADTK
jgi:PPOX class probable F420-dependent enzyme